MTPFNSQFDKGRLNLGQFNFSKSDSLKRTTNEGFQSFDYASKRAKEMNDDPYQSSFPYRKTMHESQLPEQNYYSQPIQSTTRPKYFNSTAFRGSLEDENSRLREQNEFLQNKLSTLMGDFQQLSAIRYTEAEKSLLDQEQLIQEIKSNSAVFAERMDLLEDSIGKITEETDLPSKNESKETHELKTKLKKLQKSLSEVVERERKLKIIKELSGLEIKGTKVKTDGTEYIYNLTGRNGSLDFSLFIPNQESKQVTYTPMIEPHQATSLNLPDFLNVGIVFDRSQLNRFFWRLSTVLYEGNNEDDVQ